MTPEPPRFECSACGRAFAAPNPGFLAHNRGRHEETCLGRPRGPVGKPSGVPVPVLARIAALYRSGVSLRGIARALNEDGVPTGQGGAEWRHAAVRYLLTSPAMRAMLEREAGP